MALSRENWKHIILVGVALLYLVSFLVFTYGIFTAIIPS